MKRVVLIPAMMLLASMMVFIGCTKSDRCCETDPSLAAIDSLLWSQPDSAFVRLQDFDANHAIDSLAPFNRHYFHLLLSELLYKNDYAQSNRNELLQGEAYLDSLVVESGNRVHPDLVFLDARAHYIDGAGYYEMDSVVPACEQYLKAVELMEEHFSEKELVGKKALFMGLNYNRLAELYSKQFMPEPSVHCSQKALAYNIIEPFSPYSVSKCLYHIGVQFDKLGIADSSFFYYNKALEALPDTLNVVYRDIVASKCYSDFQLSHDLGVVCLELKGILSQVEDSSERITRYLTIGAVYFEGGVCDSAIVYLDEVFKKSNDLLQKIQAADYLKVLYQDDNNEAKAGDYAAFLSQYTVSGFGEKVQQSKLADLFQTWQLQKKVIAEKRAAGIKRNNGLSLLALLVIIVSIVMVFLKRMRDRQFRRTTLHHNETIVQLLEANEHLQEENRRLSRKKEKESAISPPVKGKRTDYDKLLLEKICIELKQRFSKKDIITTNKSQTYANLAITKKEKHLLVEAVDICCPDYSRLLLESYHNLSALDLETCRFYLIGLTDQQLAVLLQKDYTTIWRRSNKLKTMMGCCDLQSHLRHLLFEL